MKRVPRFCIFPLFFCWVFIPSLLIASDSGKAPTIAPARPFSAGDFDWRDMIPALTAAAEMPGNQGVKEMLENSAVMRTYVVDQILAGCKSGKDACAAITDTSELEQEITRRIDAIVSKVIFSQKKMSIVDYTLAQPFAFSEIAAYKSENRRDAYFVLSPADHSYTSLRVKAKYGPPFDDDIFQWYGVYKYREDNAGFRSEAVFEIDPTNDAVIKIAISSKARKNHHTRPAEPY